MTKKELLYEGKAKKLFSYKEQDKLIQYFKDDATAFNKKKYDILENKGILNNLISEHIFTHLRNNGIENHFIKRINEREQLVRKLEIIPIEVIIRNIAAGTLSKRLGIEEGKELPGPLIEFTLKNDNLDDPIISEEHIRTFEWASINEIKEIKNQSIKVNKALIDLFINVGIILVDFKIEFGRLITENGNKIILADEISPDSCRLWDKKSLKKLDKDRFRRNLGGLIDAYKEVATRLGIDIKNN